MHGSFVQEQAITAMLRQATATIQYKVGTWLFVLPLLRWCLINTVELGLGICSGHLRALAADAARELDVLGHDGDALGVDGAQVGVLKQAHQVCLSGLLQR